MNYQPILTCDSYITANIYLSKLQSENIDCYLKDEFTTTIMPVISNAIGGIKLCVIETELEKAKTILLEFENEKKQNQKCLKCGSTNVQYVVQTHNPKNILIALVSWLMASFALSKKNVYHCYSCGFEFDEIPEK